MKSFRLFKWLFSTIGSIMVLIAAWMVYNTITFKDMAATAEGTVMDLILVEGDESDTWAPQVMFVSMLGDTIVFRSSSSSNPPAFRRGEKITVYYLPSDPYQARLDSWFSMWGGATIVGGIGMVFFLLGIVPSFFSGMGHKKLERLKMNGIPVQAQIKDIRQNINLSVNGAHPWQIICEGHHPLENKIVSFKSRNLWFNPTEFITSETITVYVDRTNPQKYAVDTSPLMARQT